MTAATRDGIAPADLQRAIVRLRKAKADEDAKRAEVSAKEEQQDGAAGRAFGRRWALERAEPWQLRHFVETGYEPHGQGKDAHTLGLYYGLANYYETDPEGGPSAEELSEFLSGIFGPDPESFVTPSYAAGFAAGAKAVAELVYEEIA